MRPTQIEFEARVSVTIGPRRRPHSSSSNMSTLQVPFPPPGNFVESVSISCRALVERSGVKVGCLILLYYT